VENYVQELVEKFPQLPEDIEWHMIGEEGHNYYFSCFFFFFSSSPGHVTSSNVRKLLQVKNLACLETIDSVKSATKINKVLVEQNRNLNVFVQVNTSGEESKFGAEPEEAIELIRSVKNCSNLSFRGLMTIGDFSIFFFLFFFFLFFFFLGKLNGDAREDFTRLVSLKNEVSKEFEIPLSEIELSMGMSGDFETALKMGSTNVRIGSTIFGARPKKN
jgi:uncharacterized pyridoxal phosphate-containing UPF0001 family protein